MKNLFKNYKALLTIAFLLFFKITFGQTDTEFWFAVPQFAHQHGAADATFNKNAYFRISTYGQAADVTIEQPAKGGFITRNIHINANSFQTVDVTTEIFASDVNNVLECYSATHAVQQKGIHITSTTPVNVYYEYLYEKNPEILTLKGKNALGTSFIIPSQNQFANETDATINPPARFSFDIVATEDGTTVTITPNGGAIEAGTMTTITLKKGETYSVRAANVTIGQHLGGTIVTSNKPIAVTIKDDSLVATGWDNVGDQIVPPTLCGVDYICLHNTTSNPFTGGTEYAFVTAIQDGTVVTNNNGVPTTINKGQILSIAMTQNVNHINTSKPAYVFQIIGFENEIGGALLPPIGCRGSYAVSFVRSAAMTANFALVLVVKSSAQNNFKLTFNGAVIPFSPSWNAPVNVNGTNYVSAFINNPTGISLNNAYTISNSTDFFQLGIEGYNRTNGGASFGYFSDFKGDTIPTSTKRYSGCEINLDAGTGYKKYVWTAYPPYDATNPNPALRLNKVDTLQTYLVKNPDTTKSSVDTVWVTAQNAGCKLTQEMIVNFVFPDSLSSVFLCQGSNATLKLPPNSYYTNLQWWDGNTTSTTRTVDSTKTYWVKLYDGSCGPATTRYNVTISKTPVVNLGSYPTYCLGDGDVTLDAGVQLGNSFKWFKDNVLLPDTLRSYTVKDPGATASAPDSAHYKVVVANTCNESSSSEVFIKYDICEISIPNVFTPNNDGWNDKFIIKNVKFQSWEVKIFNRWGVKVFEKKNYNDDNAWTGEGCSDGVYYYVVTNKKTTKTGWVQLLR